jgi:hypothetical protein
VPENDQALCDGSRVIELDELRALIPATLRPAGELPRVDCKIVKSDDVVHQIDLVVPEVPDEPSHQSIARILSHGHAREVRRVTLARSLEAWPRPKDLDFGWVLATLADIRLPTKLEWLFIHVPATTTMDAVGRFATAPRALVTYNRLSRFGPGPYPGIALLDLRDHDVEWSCEANAFPDLSTLILRPRGSRAMGARWVEAIFARPAATPLLREVRVPEHWGDDVLSFLLTSPLLPQLRCLDLTNALTNRGAAILYQSPRKLEGVEELWVATTRQRREEWERLAVGARATPDPAPGELEITDDWRRRLRQRFGRRVRFDVRPGHPNL